MLFVCVDWIVWWWQYRTVFRPKNCLFPHLQSQFPPHISRCTMSHPQLWGENIMKLSLKFEMMKLFCRIPYMLSFHINSTKRINEICVIHSGPMQHRLYYSFFSVKNQIISFYLLFSSFLCHCTLQFLNFSPALLIYFWIQLPIKELKLSEAPWVNIFYFHNTIVKIGWNINGWTYGYFLLVSFKFYLP